MSLPCCPKCYAAIVRSMRHQATERDTAYICPCCQKVYKLPRDAGKLVYAKFKQASRQTPAEFCAACPDHDYCKRVCWHLYGCPMECQHRAEWLALKESRE